MDPDAILQVSKVLIHLAVIVLNKIITIRQALTIFEIPGTYKE